MTIVRTRSSFDGVYSQPLLEAIAEAEKLVAEAPHIESEADLLEGLIQRGVRMRAFEEKRSSFEDILVEVAESNRNS